jgi:hypothetical protein
MINESQSDSESTTQIAKALPILGDNIEEQSAKLFRGPNKEYFKQKEYETYQEARISMKKHCQ